MVDKRDECGCHRTCTVLPHDCEVPCHWPSCLTEFIGRGLLAQRLAVAA